MSKKNKVNELSVAGQFGVKDVPTILQSINDQIAALKGGNSNEPLTNGDLGAPFGQITSINDVPTLVRATSMVMQQEKNYAEAAKLQSVDTEKFPYKLGSHSAERWIADLSKRINEVTYKDKLDKLMAAKSKLEQFLSEDDKLNAEMMNIVDLLKS